MRISTDAQLAELISSYLHTNLLSLLAEGIVHHQHLPNLVADLDTELLVDVVATTLDLVHFGQLVFSCLILGVVNLVTCYHTHILAAAIEKTTTRVQKVAQNERQHSNTHYYEQDNAMISNSL